MDIAKRYCALPVMSASQVCVLCTGNGLKKSFFKCKILCKITVMKDWEYL